mgnify:FL=1
MSKIEVDAIDKQSGSTLTLGGSGTAVTLASGATQSGFGRTGTVDWQTGSIKTSTFTATSGEGYFVNTSGGAVTMNLPAGSAGAIVSIADYAGTFQTSNLTISPNGSDKIGGSTLDVVLDTDGQSATLVFVDATEGWITTADSSENITTNPFVAATGGTVTICGNDKIHTFTGPGTFQVTNAATCAANNVVSYVVVAGGGGGALLFGGGGAGGYRETKSPVTPYTASPLDGYPSAPNRITVAVSSIPITVGGGGAGSVIPGTPPSSVQSRGCSGSPSVFSSITATGGGGGAGSASLDGLPGGSGGGGGDWGSSGRAGGTGNTPPTTPSQGFPGGAGSAANGGGGGGGGATAVGVTGTATTGGNGGAGTTSSINGTPTARAGGGGSGIYLGACGTTTGTGGTGGGGPGGPSSEGPGVAGTANTGGGGGGGSRLCAAANGGNGGSGIVIIRYKFQ